MDNKTTPKIATTVHNQTNSSCKITRRNSEHTLSKSHGNESYFSLKTKAKLTQKLSDGEQRQRAKSAHNVFMDRRSNEIIVKLLDSELDCTPNKYVFNKRPKDKKMDVSS